MPELQRVFVYSQPQPDLGITEKLIGTPFLLREDGLPVRECNLYFINRRLGNWAPNIQRSGRNALANGQQRQMVSNGYLKNRAYHLNSLVINCEEKGIPILELQQGDLFRFHEDLEKRIANSAAHQCMLTAVDWIEFCVDAKLRTSVVITRRKSSSRYASKGTPHVAGRSDPAELEVWYSERQLNGFISELDEPADIIAAEIMLGTGMRVSETISLASASFPDLKEYDADPKKRRITIRGKGNKIRRVPIPRSLLEKVDNYKRVDRAILLKRFSATSDQLLLRSWRHRVRELKVRSLQKRFEAARKNANTPHVTPHILRHHFAAFYLIKAWQRQDDVEVILDLKGGKKLLIPALTQLQSILGHSSVETTSRYLEALVYFFSSEWQSQLSDVLDGK